MEQRSVALFPEDAAAVYLGYSPRTLQGWRTRGGGPVFVKVSATSVRYRKADLDRFIESKLRTSTSDPGPEPEG